MPQDKKSITLTLTPEQQEKVRQATGKLTDTLEMSIKELEERITPNVKWK
jgi:DNA-binding MarR family transcriptional regulator